MRSFDTMTAAVQQLQKEDFTYNFKFHYDTLECLSNGEQYHTDQFEIVETFRFEGKTNPSDSSILYTIQTHDGLKGLLADSYGAASDPISIEMIDKFQLENKSKK
ncbi:MAG: phosphoribosylpyrophosphate synthetase [Salibacteraceae bacterium]